MSRLLVITVTSSMVFPTLREAILTAVRWRDSVIIDVSGDQKCYRLQMHNVNLEIYSKQREGMELLQVEIEAGTNSNKLA